MNHPVAAALLLLNGVARRSELLAAGVSAGALEKALRSGALIRVRHGVYASPHVDRGILRAVRVGGALAGGSATRLHDLWQPPDRRLTVSVAPTAARLRDPDNARRRLDPRRDDILVMYDSSPVGRDERLVVGVERCVTQVLRTYEPAHALAVVDSSQRLPTSRRPSLTSMVARVPQRCHAVLRAADARSESGTESILRWRLAQAGIKFEIQVWLTSAIRVDFRLSDSLVVECTSYAYHASPQQYADDRVRIAAVVQLGYFVLEFTYEQVLFAFEEVLATIDAARALL
jgi:very-short-patch-repair endonuclease